MVPMHGHKAKGAFHEPQDAWLGNEQVTHFEARGPNAFEKNERGLSMNRRLGHRSPSPTWRLPEGVWIRAGSEIGAPPQGRKVHKSRGVLSHWMGLGQGRARIAEIIVKMR